MIRGGGFWGVIYWGIIRKGWLLAGWDCEMFLAVALSLSWGFCDGNVIEKDNSIEFRFKIAHAFGVKGVFF